MMLAATAACSSGHSGSSPDPSSTSGDGGMGSGSGMGDGGGMGSGGGMGGGSGSGMGDGGGSGGGSGSDGGMAVCSRDGHGIVLPDGFCATVFADHVGTPRHIAVTPSGHVFVANDGHVLSLFDADGDGVAEQQQVFGEVGGNGIAWKDGRLYVAADDRIVRFTVPDGAALPAEAEPAVIVSGLPATGDHTAKTVVLINDALYVNIGSPSNACQVANRQLHSPGKDACDELPTRAGIWEFDATMTDQTMSCGERVATGMRNTNAMALDADAGTLWGAINGRDQLHDNWPELYTAAQDTRLPSDEVVAITDDLDRGWPYCYHDPVANQMKLAPEYGGDGAMQGRCAAIAPPAIALPAHAAPLGMAFATGAQFPPEFRSGAFVANHGSRFDADAAAADLHGYDVEFIAFEHGMPTGRVVPFATGFDAGMRPLPDAAPHRPVGLAMMPDGSLLIGDDQGGRIWRVFYPRM